MTELLAVPATETQQAIPLPQDLITWEQQQDEALEASMTHEVPQVLLPTLPDAQRALARVRYFRHKASDVEAVFASEIAVLEQELARVKAAREDALKPWVRRESWYLFALEEFTRAQNAADSKLKTIKLPAGNLELKAQQPQWNYGDESALVDILTNVRPGCVRVKREVDKTGLKQAADVRDGKAFLVDPDTGELVELPVTVTTKPPAFSIKTA